MKKIVLILPIVALIATSCKKEQECECTTVFYDENGYYLNSTKKDYMVSDDAECQSYNTNTASEVTNCGLDTE
ncbi:MAG: hypothetical protein M9916_05250 [Crocinitomicaceae bacterium]|nr:hypothetical protein [Crocinitomicaceae bacterium]